SRQCAALRTRRYGSPGEYDRGALGTHCTQLRPSARRAAVRVFRAIARRTERNAACSVYPLRSAHRKPARAMNGTAAAPKCWRTTFHAPVRRVHTMLDKLDFMVRFWQLRARHDAIGAPLSAFERVELLSLIRLMAQDLRLPEP